MFARIVMFGIALLALWLIWRAIRQWIDANAARGEVDEQREARRLSHQRADGSTASIAAGSSGDGVRRGGDYRDPDAARDVDAPPGQGHPAGSDPHGDGGSGGGGDSGGGGGGGGSD